MVAAFATQIRICSGPSLQIRFVCFSFIPVPPKTQNPAKTLIFRLLKSAQIRLHPFFRVRLNQADSAWFSLTILFLVLGSQVHSLHLAAQIVQTCSVEHARNPRDSDRSSSIPSSKHLYAPSRTHKAQRLEPTYKKQRKITEFLKKRTHLSKQVCYTQIWVP